MEIPVNTPFGPGILMEKGQYRDGSTALHIIHAEEGDPICCLTVCCDLGPLGENEYLVKTWSENASAAEQLLTLGIFEDTGKRVPTGYVQAEIWKLKV